MKKVLGLFLSGMLGMAICSTAYAYRINMSANYTGVNTSLSATADVTSSPGTYTFQWSAAYGTISGSGATVTYNAPDTKCTDTITCIIKSGASTVATVKAQVVVFKRFIIFKTDDLRNQYISNGSTYKNYFEYMMNTVKEVFSAGLITIEVDPTPSQHADINGGQNSPVVTAGFKNYLINMSTNGYCELWSHGYIHEDFATFTEAIQLERLQLSMDLIRTQLNLTCHGFGSPFNSTNADSCMAMNTLYPAMVYSFFNNHSDFDDPPSPYSPYKGITFWWSTYNYGEVDTATNHVSSQAFVNDWEGITHTGEQNEEVNCLQMHPSAWSYPSDMTSLACIVDYLHTYGATFILPFDWWQLKNVPGFTPPNPYATDTTPPDAPGEVRDGTGQIDANATASTFTLTANWDRVIDAESGIRRYLYAIGTVAGGTDVTNGWIDNFGSVSVTKTGLGLTAGTAYYFSVKAQNGVGMMSPAANSNGITVGGNGSDTTPPVISAVTAPAGTLAQTSAGITWTTNEDASSQVEYGETTGYGTQTTEDDNLGTSHSVTLTSLTEGTLYHYRVKSKDASNNPATSSDYTFTTLATGVLPDTTPPEISAVAAPAASITQTTAIITWTTNESATSQVDYGLTTAYASGPTTETAVEGTSHSVSLTGLIANTLYHYRAKSKDASNNPAVSIDYTFTTLAEGVTPPSTSTVSGAKPYPNPCDLAVSKPKFIFSSSSGGEVKIYTMNGILVKTLSANSSIKQWDGKNDDGETVSKGVYIYKIKNAGGSESKGKLIIK